MFDVVQGTVVPPVATRKGIPNKNRSTTPTRFRSKPKIVNFAHPFFFNFAHRAARAALFRDLAALLGGQLPRACPPRGAAHLAVLTGRGKAGPMTWAGADVTLIPGAHPVRRARPVRSRLAQ